MTEGWLNSVLVRVAPLALATLMRLLFATCRVRVHNPQYFLPARDSRPIIASFWHYSLVFIFWQMRHYKATVMVSASRDGDYIARVAHQFGFITTRGSRNNRGSEALKGLFRAVRSGGHCALVADGSQGPPRKAQPGALLLAARTGAPIVPMAWSASSYWVIRSWDRTAIPKPFSTIDFIYGEPLFLSREADEQVLEKARQLLEDRLNDIYLQAWGLRGKTGHADNV